MGDVVTCRVMAACQGRGKRAVKILVIDDEPALCQMLEKHLTMAGYQALCATTGIEGLRVAAKEQPDVVLLDVLLPDMDGREICRRLRKVSDVPIIMLSVLAKEGDIIRGLYAGADDYLVKPVRMSELMARIRVQLRRTAGSRPKRRGYDDGVLTVDPLPQMVEKDGQRVHLSRTEYRLLSVLIESQGEVVSPEELCRRVWPDEEDVDVRRATLYVSYLRRKLEEDPSAPQYLHTVRGQGYVFEYRPSPDVTPR